MQGDIYGEALRQMGAEPLEQDEPVGWGGSRPGAGRKAGPAGSRIRVTITLDPALVEWVDSQAETLGINRSAYVNQLIEDARESCTN